MQFLLFGEDQALYAGQVDDVDLTDRKIIPTLSSLVILEAFDCLPLLRERRDSVIIPESLLLFVRNRVEQMKKTLAVSPGKMYNLPDGRFTMIPPSTSSLKIWENIFEYCLEFQIVRVLDKEVAEFPFLEQMSGESLFNKFRINRSQLECMILSKREEAVLLSDDLFYRKIAGITNILNVNSGCLLKNLGDEEFAKDVIVTMSASNYIYIPFIEFGVEYLKTVVTNLSKGKYKKKYYSFIFDTINRIVSDFFSGNNYCTELNHDE